MSDDCGKDGCGARQTKEVTPGRVEVRTIESSPLIIDSQGKQCRCTELGDPRAEGGEPSVQPSCFALHESVREKELLIREIHHRVKNNLQVISSLLSLQGRSSASVEAQRACEESQLRIKSIALIHELLYRSENMTRIRATEYVERLGVKLLSAFGLGDRVVIAVDDSPALIDLDHAVPFGLVINELMTNAMRHAFPSERRGRIGVRLVLTDSGRVQLDFRDDGVGLPMEVEPLTAVSLGFRLIASLVQQLDGTWSLDRRDGTGFLIDFPLGK